MHCNRCGVSIHQGLQICPHCGARQKQRSTQVTCTHCRYHAPFGSSVCPRCGQVLRARRFRRLAIPIVAGVLLAAIFVVTRNPGDSWEMVQLVTQQKLAVAGENLNELGGKVLDTASTLADNTVPMETPTPTQVVVLAEPPAEDQAVLVALAPETPLAEVVVAPTTVSIATNAVTVTVAVTAQAVVLADPELAATLATVSAPEAPIQEPPPTEAPTRTPLPTPSPTSTNAVVATAPKRALAPTGTPLPPTPTPTSTQVPPTPTPTATPIPPTDTPQPKVAASAAEASTYVVQSGDDWYSIARRYGITQDELAAANDTTPSDILQVDQKLRIPRASTTEAASSQPTLRPTSAATQVTVVSTPQTYTVKRGDNWFSIAKRFGITQESLADYNGRSVTDILQIDQKLRIPPAGGIIVPKPTPTIVAKPSSTATPEPIRVPEVLVVAKLPAPVLLSPMPGDGFSPGAKPVLTWQPVPGLTADDHYYVQLSFTMRNGGPGLVESQVTEASFTVPQWFFDAAQPPDHIGRWSIQVRRRGPAGEAIEISPFSETRTFYWR